MSRYYRITGYCPKNDYCFILDSNGMFKELWQFSSYLVKKGFKILYVSKEENFIDININKVEENFDNVFLHASTQGLPQTIEYKLNGTNYKAIKVADKIYIPKK